ncbi:AAA family ATPase [Lachnospiraceae bacterium WCA-9-b2]|uniref:AAA family ATPase n=4 Tax=Sporofaciens musculi TaxID=2681861 RepID=A0A7X3SIZ9_9FIRM|nr:AAA family ATPase [Sporofaciens musculi]MXP76108.1 AAA family ATPase [Sporofaciens musculi]
MEMRKKKLPIGIENFEEIRKEDFYYIDKTGLIVELLHNWGAVNLFTRPRRFGKSLNMSMLEHFFSLDGDKSIFDGLEISKETSLCEEYMGKYPVVSISLKGMDALNFERAFRMGARSVRRAASKAQYLLESDALSESDKLEYQSLLNSNMDESTFCDSLRILSEMLEKHHNTKVILLIDEYDVPLAKAHANGYYDQMISLIRSLLGEALKTNASLKLAVLTGCLRISKESIFTGLNNLKIRSVTDVRFDEYFGFTDTEVKTLLGYYGYPNSYDVAKKWYNGYHFGNVDVYCPWDVLNYCDSLLDDEEAQPENYWINTSSNDAVKRFIQESANYTTKREIESLVAGEVITKEIHQELTYPEVYQTIDNIWSLLFTTGYLTQRGKAEGRQMKLAIPNLEIRDIYVTQIMEFFKENVQEDGDTLNRFCDALRNKDVENVEKIFTEYLRRTISIRDTAVRTNMKENFYHGVLLGILGVKNRWGISSNREMGEGYADILAEPDTGDMGIIIEVKYAHDGDLDAACKEALKQIEYTRYEDDLKDDGVENILKYGIACYKKRCRVMLAEK